MTQLRTEQSFHALQLRCKFAGALNDEETRIRTEDLQGPLVQLTSLFESGPQSYRPSAGAIAPVSRCT